MSTIALLFHLKMRFYLHYYMIYIPIIVVAIILSENIEIKIIRTKIKSNILALITVALIVFAGVKCATCIIDVKNVYNLKEIIKKEEIQAKDIVDNINIKNNIIVYNVSPNFYLMTDINPCYRNFILQDFHTDIVEIRKGFIKDLNSLKARYIVTNKNNEGKYTKFINDNYHVIKENDIYLLYEKNKN